MHHYYANGDTEHCPVYVGDFMACLQAQTERNAGTKQELLEKTSVVVRQRSKNSIFSFKEVPSWET